MGGGGGSTKTEPWKQAQPYILEGYKAAQNLYNQGPAQFFPGQTYVSPSEATTSALNMAESRAMSGSPLVGQAQGAASNLMSYTNPYAAQIAALGGTATDPSADFYRQLMEGQLGGSSEAMDMARRTASGEFLNANPYLEGALSRANRLATDQFMKNLAQTKSAASSAGRYGSRAAGRLEGESEDIFARALTEQNQQAFLQNYMNERTAQENAIGRLAGLEQQGLSNRMAGAGALTAGQQQALATRLGAMVNAGTMTAADANRQLQAAQLAPSLAEADYMDMQKLLMVGQAREGYDAAALQDAMARWNFDQNADWENLSRYQSAISGFPMGTTSSSGGK